MLPGCAASILSEPSGLSGLVTGPAARPSDEAVAGVSRETYSPSRDFGLRHSIDAAPTPKGARARTELIDATVALIAQGNLRPTPVQVARRAGRAKSHVHTHFDCMHMLLRATVRSRTAELVVALKLPGSLSAAERERLVWLIVAGVEKPR